MFTKAHVLLKVVWRHNEHSCLGCISACYNTVGLYIMNCVKEQFSPKVYRTTISIIISWSKQHLTWPTLQPCIYVKQHTMHTYPEHREVISTGNKAEESLLLWTVCFWFGIADNSRVLTETEGQFCHSESKMLCTILSSVAIIPLEAYFGIKNWWSLL